jgi:hypothetical protein
MARNDKDRINHSQAKRCLHQSRRINQMNGQMLTKAETLTQDISDTVDDMFEYHAWDEEQETAGAQVRRTLADAVKAIIENVPPSADRSTAIRKIREARMDANSAIAHGGKY